MTTSSNDLEIIKTYFSSTDDRGFGLDHKQVKWLIDEVERLKVIEEKERRGE